MKNKNRTLVLKKCLTQVTPFIGMTTVVLLGALPSQANWYLDHYEAAGSNTALNSDEYYSSGPWPNNPARVNGLGYWNSNSLVGGGSEVKAAGSVTAVFKWNGQTPFPGGKVGILFESEAFAEADKQATITLNPGTTLLPIQPEDVESDTAPSRSQRARKGKQLFTKQVAPAATEITQKITLSSIASDDATVYVLAKAVYDPRSVVLTRSGAPTPIPEKVVVNDQLVNNPDLKKERDEWIEGDGTGHGHSLTSYWVRNLVTNEAYDDPIDVTNTINATRSGPWSATNLLDYEWTPNTGDNLPTNADTTWRESKVVAETMNYQIRQMIRSNAIDNSDGVTQYPFGGAYHIDSTKAGWVNLPSDKRGTLVDFQYKLTDNTDQASAISKYGLTLHDVWEDTDVVDTRFPLPANVGPNNSIGSGISYESYYYVPPGAIGAGRGNSKWSIGQNNTFTVNLQAAFELGFKIKDWVSASGSAEVSRAVTVTEEMISTANSLEVPTGPNATDIYAFAGPDAYFKAVVVFNAKRVHKLVNRFGINGFMPHSSTISPVFPRSSTLWGRTPQSKIDDLDTPRADWYPYDPQVGAPADNSSGAWTGSGTFS